MPRWAAAALLLALLFTAYCFLAFWGDVARESPEQAWVWPAAWIPSLAFVPLVWLFFGRLRVAVENRVLSVRFGFWPLVHREFALERIASAVPIRYRPILNFGGWGIRRGRHDGRATLAYSLQGSTGVLLTLTAPVSGLWLRTDRILIGSLDAEALADVLNAARAS